MLVVTRLPTGPPSACRCMCVGHARAACTCIAFSRQLSCALSGQSLPRSSLTAGLTSTAENKIDSSIPSAASASAQTSAHDSTDSPAHPWSVANPRFLASAGNPQSNAPTVSPQAAAAPVGAPLAGPDSTAIPPSDPEPGAPHAACFACLSCSAAVHQQGDQISLSWPLSSE